ncbi:MAG: heavy metal-associated domain-containing protein [Bryobacteraceae bacterium]
MTCAHAVRVAISKFEGVEDVNVSLQRGHAKVKLRPGNPVELKKIMAAIGDQALAVRHVSIVANGSATPDPAEKWSFVVKGTGERIALREPPAEYRAMGEWKMEFAIPKKSKDGDPAVLTRP